MTANPRIALLGFMLESNGFSAPAEEAEFRQKLFLEGDALLEDARAETSRDPGGIKGFVAEMDRAGPWRPVPLAITSAGASGPVEQGFFDRYLVALAEKLRAALPLDGVYIEAHGAATATVEPDPEGTLYAMVREVVGLDVPVVSTLDLHANVSRAMVERTDLLIAYLTNPHVDMFVRGEEAGRAMRELLGGVRTSKAFVRLPILPASVTLLSDRGPYGAAIARGQELCTGPILNVSVLGNFSLGDCAKNGMSVIVTSRGDQAAAEAVARELAGMLWARREEFIATLTPVEEAARRLKEACDNPALPPLLFADVADNPGGGARGNTTAILRAFLEAGIDRTAFAIHFDPELALEAHSKGQGARFRAVLNRSETTPGSDRLEAEAEVMALSDGNIVGRRGIIGNRRQALGLTAWLRLEGRIDVVFVSIRHQCADTATMEHLGLDPRALRGIVVKSRGHFRAGFDDLFADEQILEVDGPGLVTPMLSRVPFRNLPRPIFPLDEAVEWTVPVDVSVG
ncbi:M81 family metallopeptidase [Pseudoroseomonas globiformis]|uniref:Microcystinase C n=1 Tax=Teichococcus globiformis TaxID=2307229 RepID=A0ABV7G1P0_9PROT